MTCSYCEADDCPLPSRADVESKLWRHTKDVINCIKDRAIWKRYCQANRGGRKHTLCTVAAALQQHFGDAPFVQYCNNNNVIVFTELVENEAYQLLCAILL